MEKPLDVPLLVKTIAEMVAEESETHLKRLAGLRRDLRYVPPAHHHVQLIKSSR
jgi:hypothetical protein